MKKYSELLFSLLMLFLFINIAGAQSQQTTNSTTDPKTGVRVTTMVKPLPTLIEQVRDFETKLANAERDPKLVDNGTIDKYKLVLIQLRKDLEIENIERKRLESLEKK
jgi:hypothetical protein